MNTKIIIKTMGLMFVCLLYTGCFENFFNNAKSEQKDGFKRKKAPELFRHISRVRVLIHTYEGRIKTLTDDAIACSKDSPIGIIKLHAAKALSSRLNMIELICKSIESLMLQDCDIRDIEDNIAGNLDIIIACVEVLISETEWVSKMIPYVEKIDEDILLEAMSGESIDQLRNIDTDEALNKIFNKYSEIIIGKS